METYARVSDPLSDLQNRYIDDVAIHATPAQIVAAGLRRLHAKLEDKTIKQAGTCRLTTLGQQDNAATLRKIRAKLKEEQAVVIFFRSRIISRTVALSPQCAQRDYIGPSILGFRHPCSD